MVVSPFHQTNEKFEGPIRHYVIVGDGKLLTQSVWGKLKQW